MFRVNRVCLEPRQICVFATDAHPKMIENTHQMWAALTLSTDSLRNNGHFREYDGCDRYLSDSYIGHLLDRQRAKVSNATSAETPCIRSLGVA
jgi:hypothetical protein